MKPAVFDPAAQAEAQAAAAHYDAIRPDLADDFRADLADTLVRIGTHPLMYPVEQGSFRSVALSRFPYSLIYEDRPAEVWVVAVAHHRRRPGYWSRRRP